MEGEECFFLLACIIKFDAIKLKYVVMCYYYPYIILKGLINKIGNGNQQKEE